MIAGCALLGGPCGIIRRRGRGSGAVVLLAAVLAPALAGVVVGLSYLFAGIRELTLLTLRATAVGVIHIAEFLRLPRRPATPWSGSPTRSSVPGRS